MGLELVTEGCLVGNGFVSFLFFFFRMGEDIALGIGKCVYIIVYVFVENGSIE